MVQAVRWLAEVPHLTCWEDLGWKGALNLPHPSPLPGVQQESAFWRDLHFTLNMCAQANSEGLLTYISKHCPYRFLGLVSYGKTKLTHRGTCCKFCHMHLKYRLQLPAFHPPNLGFLGRESRSTALALQQPDFISTPSQAKKPSVCHNYQMVFIANWQQTPFGVSIFWLGCIVSRIQEPARLSVLFNTKIKLWYN